MSNTLNILLITPPLTQLNAPYPAVPYLKGFLKTINCRSVQADLGLELSLRLFSAQGLREVFEEVRKLDKPLSFDAGRALKLEREYIKTIDPTIRFLQNKDSSLAYQISRRSYLPEGPRFKNLPDLDWHFGGLGIHDKAKLLSSLYLEELADFIKETVCPSFGFSRYAESLALAATSFSPIEKKLNKPDDLIDRMTLEILRKHLRKTEPDLVGFSVPFPGCLLGALKCGQYIKKFHPRIKIALGGGYVNTELRELSDPRIFQYLDFITLDFGEAPLRQIIKYLKGEIETAGLKRTYILSNREVKYIDSPEIDDVRPADAGVPDYSDLLLDKYPSIIEIANPAHRLWNDGRWNKLTVAQGCYWRKCAFCDVDLPYIKKFQTIPTDILIERVEKMIELTGQTGFHFVDEAAPPQALKKLAIQLIQRNISITWWTNIRFEKVFSASLCRLLAASGCAAVSGGLESAHDRLLKKMNKGVALSQAIETLNNFKKAGVLAHAYLMRGFPGQTASETIDALEIVRQLFLNGLVDSAFWHRFSLTAHSPMAKNPARNGITITGPEKKGFAVNDLNYIELKGVDHEVFGPGLNKAVYNYMHGIGVDYETSFWFNFKVPRPTVSPRRVKNIIKSIKKNSDYPERQSKKALWLGQAPDIFSPRSQDNPETKKAKLRFYDKKDYFDIKVDSKTACWLERTLSRASAGQGSGVTLRELADSYQQCLNRDFQIFSRSGAWKKLRKKALLLL